MRMTPKERVLAAFEHRPADRVPIYQSGFSSRAASHILGREAFVGGGIQQWRESVALWEGTEEHAEFLERSTRDALELSEILDLDLARPQYWRLLEKPSRRLDDETFFYGDDAHWRIMHLDRETELYQVTYHFPKVKLSLDDLEAVVEKEEKQLEEDHPKEEDFNATREGIRLFRDQRAVLGYGNSLGIPFEESAWLEATALRKDLVARMLDVQVEKALRNIPLVAKTGARFMAGGGDCASNNGPFYSPLVFRELVLPRLQKISEACHQYHLFHLFASDGNLWPLADDLFGKSGVDCLYETDRRAGMDLGRLRESFPRLSILGGISSHTLHHGSRQEVVEEALSALEAARRWGSIVVGCSNQIVSQTPPENVLAMIETLQKNRG